MTAWRAANEQLRSTDQGKRLASDPELLAQYHALASQARPGPTLPVDLRARLKPLQTLIDEATQANNPLFSPAEQLESQLASIQGEAQQGSKLYGDHNQQLQAILARLPAAPTAQALALDEALKALETKHANDRTRRLAEELDKARRENTEKDAQAQAENERRLAQVEGEAKRKLADAEAQRAQAEAERKATEIGRDTQAEKDLAEEHRRKKKEQEEEARLEREFQNDWPEIQAMLKPLLDPAYTQPVKGMQPQVTTTKGPVSLGALRATGAFAEDQTGLYELQRAIYYDRDRNKGRWPRLEDKEFFIKAQRYLLKYGNLMVKKGLLAP